MGKVIVIQYVTLDGIVEDPDGSGGTPGGGWAFRFGPATVAGDKFELGPILDTGVLLFGRSTWELFSRLWPPRTTDFAAAMNRIEKVVVSHSTPALDAWNNSSVLDDELLHGVKRLADQRDVVVIGSTSVVHALAAADAVDEYRLFVVPTALGTRRPLFATPVDLQLLSAVASPPGVLLRYERGA